jgi:negative regulator of flagellin synthesis FlgM
MKINSEQSPASLNKVANAPVAKNEVTDSGKKGSTLATDRINLAANSEEIAQLKKAMQVAPELGSERVNQLKEQIASGTYKVDGKEVAAKMLQNWSELNSK